MSSPIPLLAKVAKSERPAEPLTTVYDHGSETSTLPDGALVLKRATGSDVTKATADPTSDEATDR